MADLKISQLPAATVPLAGTELVPIVQGGITEQVTVANLTAGRAVSALSMTTTNGSVLMYSTSANASARNWGMQSNTQSFGDWALYQSNAKDGNPLTAGTIRMYGTRTTGQVIFGGGTSTAGSSGPLASVSANNDYIIVGNNTHATDPYGLFIRYTAASPNGNGNPFFYFDDSTALRARMQSNGGLANYSGNNTNLSDRREKTDIVPAKSYLDVVCAIPVQTFKYIDQTDEEKTLGVIAQDVQAVAPELVMESNWGTEEDPKVRLAVYQTDLQYALMKALQELKAEFDEYVKTHP